VRQTVRAVAVLLVIRGVLALWPAAPLSERVAHSVAVYDRRGQLLRLTLAADERYRLWLPLDELASALVEATLLYEDRHFRHHPGFNPVSLARAAVATYLHRGPRVGGSTVSMQVARRLYGVHSRNLGGKLRQLGWALWLELRYSKRALLEAYLNLAPYGLNIEGAGAASWLYFHKAPGRLEPDEALTLAVIPKSPVRRAPIGSTRPPGTAPYAVTNGALLRARRALFARWSAGREDGSSVALAMDQPLQVYPLAEVPFEAPHFVQSVLAESNAVAERRLFTSLDLRLQHIVERHLRSYVARVRERGVTNAAALLVDTRTNGIRAAVGSADFWSRAIDGQVDGTRAPRSPGSTLKPFVYALALEQGVVHPRSMLKDLPTSFGGFTPDNFDGRFVGPISARDALNRSRNLPAVALAARLEHPSLYDFLRTAGVRLRPESHYGLSLVLGSAEVTMEELVQLYSALGHHGLLRPLGRLREAERSRTGGGDETGLRVLGEAAAFLTVDMLADNPRPGRFYGERSSLSHGEPGPVAWKTGTSYGFRDAWTVGLFGPYALAVWLGNFSGAGNPALVGVQLAAPLFFEIVDSLVAQGLAQPPLARKPPPTVAKVAVCAVSGSLPTDACPLRRDTWFIPGVSPIEPCTIHRQVVIDSATGRRTCPPFHGPTHTEVYEFWPSELARLFTLAGLPRRGPPAADGHCDPRQEVERGFPPAITSPVRGLTYTVRSCATGASDRQGIALQANADADASSLYWFVDDRWVGTVATTLPLLWQPTHGGRFVVRVVDDRGRADTRVVWVATP
jgi:penicillin-binding protein 1C